MGQKQSAEYRRKAEKALAEAENAPDSAVKANLLEIASRFEWLADWFERRPDTSSSPGHR